MSVVSSNYPKEIEMSKTFTVTVCGPNLRTQGEAFHVHAAGCKDLGNYGRGRKLGGDDKGFTMTVADLAEITTDVYPPGDFDYDETSDELDSYSTDFKVFPCVGRLPYRATEVGSPVPSPEPSAHSVEFVNWNASGVQGVPTGPTSKGLEADRIRYLARKRGLVAHVDTKSDPCRLLVTLTVPA